MKSPDIPRVLFLSHAQKFSGAEMVTLRLLDHSRNRLETRIVLPEGDFYKVLQQKGLHPIRCNHLSALNRKKSSTWPFQLLVKLLTSVVTMRKLIRDFNPTVIYATHFSTLIYGLVLSKLFRKPLIWHMHDIFTPQSIEGKTLRWLSPFFTNVISISDVVSKGLMACGVSESKITLVYNGLDTQDPVEDLEPLPPDFPAKDDQKIMLMQLGIIAPHKGQAVFIKALARLKEIRPTVDETISGLIVGDYHPNDVDYVEGLIQSISDNQLESILSIRPKTKALKSLYDLADIIVIPSQYEEPFGLVAIEAMACHKLVVASNRGGLSEIVEHGVSGYLFNNEDELASILDRIIDQNIQISSTVNAGYNRFVMRYSIDKHVDKMLDVFRGVGATS